MGVVEGCKQLDRQRAAAQLVTKVLYDTAQAILHDLTGVPFGSERMHTMTTQVAEGLTVVDVAPSREEITRRIAEVAGVRFRRPVLVHGRISSGHVSLSCCDAIVLTPIIPYALMLKLA